MALNFSEVEFNSFIFMCMIEQLQECLRIDNPRLIKECKIDDCTMDTWNTMILTKKDPNNMASYELASNEYYIVEFLGEHGIEVTKVYGSDKLIVTAFYEEYDEDDEWHIEVKLLNKGWESTDSAIIYITADDYSICYGPALCDPNNVESSTAEFPYPHVRK